MEQAGTAVLNADSPASRSFQMPSRERGLKVISMEKMAKKSGVIELKPEAKGQAMRFDLFGKKL